MTMCSNHFGDPPCDFSSSGETSKNRDLSVSWESSPKSASPPFPRKPFGRAGKTKKDEDGGHADEDGQSEARQLLPKACRFPARRSASSPRRC